ncbi:MAG: response regulator [Haloferacaceae archaeon]
MSGQTGTVLVADNDPTVAAGIASALRPDHTVRVAEGGEEALRLLDDSIDVALLDRRMPDRSGDEVLSEIRRRGIDCRVAMVTGVQPDFDVVEMPFDDYVVKPVDGEELRSLVARLLRRAEYRDRVRELYALAAKRAALVAAKDDAELASDPRFEALKERFDRLDDDLSETVRTLEAREAFDAAIGD